MLWLFQGAGREFPVAPSAPEGSGSRVRALGFRRRASGYIAPKAMTSRGLRGGSGLLLHQLPLAHEVVHFPHDGLAVLGRLLGARAIIEEAGDRHLRLDGGDRGFLLRDPLLDLVETL